VDTNINLKEENTLLNDFPIFMKSNSNAISPSSQSKGVQGWLYESIDGKQMIYWVCKQPVISSEHTHEYDEYFIVVQGTYTLVFRDKEVEVKQGEEYHIPKGVPHADRSKPNTRTIHCFGGKRAEIIS
jgi:mannose-6-phosphate isomerase-like protein (cupin superfamily)